LTLFPSVPAWYCDAYDLHEFIAKWRKVELKERSAAQEHFLDLCHVFGHPTPAAADPTGETFCFERGAAKHGGGDGFADVWKRGFFGWEYKGKHKDLSAAFDQLLRYRDALENPPLLVLCDLDCLVVRTNFTGTVSAVHEIPLEALAEPRSIEIMRAVFHNPESLRPGRTSATVTQEAAVQIGEIAAAMRGRGLDPAAVAHFLDRIVFCLFAEDAGLLPDMVFSRMLEKAGGDPARFGKTLAMLFEAMATGGDFGLETIRHFNGSLFDDRTVPDLAPDDVKRFSAASSLDWSAVDPSIFGTLFERGLDPAKRAQLGAHFTGMADIELVVDAVVLTPLRREWQETKTVIENLLITGKKTGFGNRESGSGYDAQQVDSDAQGNSLTPNPDSRLPSPELFEPEWPTVDFIVGNPPFLGDKLMRRELGDAYVDQLRSLYANRIPGQSDLCCYWFEKARAHIAAGKCNRAGLLATQGIRGGANREVLKRIKDSGDIFWAESDRPWVLDGANVHVSMVGFDGGEETSRLLDGKLVSTINANLTSAADTGIAHGLPANCDIGFIGTTKKAPLDISDDAAQKLLLSPNPHGRPNSDIVRPWMNGLHITRRELAQWIIDYPISFSQSDAALYEGPYAYVVENVKPIRDNHREAVQAKYWWRQARPCPEMQQAIAILPRCLVTPRVSKHRLFAWVDAVVVPDCQLVVFARADDYFFGVLHSRFHEVWALAQGTQLREKESGFRYTPTSCFETFPFPEADPDRDAAIASAARELNELREGWLNPPDWTRTETLEFPGTVGGPWNRYIDPATVHPLPTPDFRLPTPVLIGTVRYPRLVPRDADCAARLKERTLTKLYNARPAWLADCHARLDAAVAAAYGWPADLSDDAILERLLALNLERAKAK
jgi:hypothetical protein